MIKEAYDLFAKTGIPEADRKYRDYLKDIGRREGQWQKAKTILGDVGTFGKNVVLTTPDAIGATTKIPTRAAGFEYTPWDPGGYAQKWRKDAITPWSGGIAGMAPWIYSKIGGIPWYTHKGRDETGGWGAGTKLLASSGIADLFGVEGPYKKTQEKMAGHSDNLLNYYLGDGINTHVGDTVPWKNYASKNWTSKMTNDAVKDYDKQFNEENTWNEFLEELEAINESGKPKDQEFVQHAYNNLQAYYDQFKEDDQESFIQTKMMDELLPEYMKESSGKYRKELLDEYGMYPLDIVSGGNVIDYGKGAKFYTADQEYADQKYVEGKGGHLMMPDDFDMGIFKGFTEMDWAPYRYSSDEAMDLFENPWVRFPAELAAWPTAGIKAGTKMLPKGLQWGLKQTMPGTFSREGVKRFKYLPKNWRRYGQLPIVAGVSEMLSDRGDDFR